MRAALTAVQITAVTAVTAIIATAAITATAAPAYASQGRGVGLGIASGLAFSPTKLKSGNVERQVGSAFAWGFFVDIPLLSTFYISPAAMLYELNLDGAKRPVTDIDINFKFIVPIAKLRIGAGATMGLTSLERAYVGHYGVLAYTSYSLVPNFDLFVLAQYKHLNREPQGIDNLHGFAGGMFRF